jgi:guanylate kinase
MFVLSSPSGAGKTTLSRLLIERMPGLKMSVSATTRAKRPGEVDGRDYLFVDKPRFESMVKDDELLEWATVFDNRYGTPRAPVEAALSAGQDVLFDIDWQGTQQLREKARADVVSVFILPPSAGDLEKRLHSRAQDSDEVIRKRMSRASHEMSHWAEYDYIVINHDVDEAFAEVQSILKAERLKRERRIGLVGFVRGLQGQLQG